MPELPDLQVFSHNLNKKLKNKIVQKVSVHNDKKLNVPVAELQNTLAGQKLKEVYREGKELFFQFDTSLLSIHLMLNGKLFFYDGANDQRFTILELLFDDEAGLALTDFQGMANASLNPEKKTAPDALAPEITARFLQEKLAKKRTPIKTLLLDQHFIRGIGNAYADEILYEARISPLSVSNKIPEDKISKLVESIKAALEDAERQIRSSHPEIIAGEVRDFLKVHNSKKKLSPGGAEIRFTEIGSRKTYYTDEQELFK